MTRDLNVRNVQLDDESETDHQCAIDDYGPIERVAFELNVETIDDQLAEWEQNEQSCAVLKQMTVHLRVIARRAREFILLYGLLERESYSFPDLESVAKADPIKIKLTFLSLKNIY